MMHAQPANSVSLLPQLTWLTHPPHPDELFVDLLGELPLKGKAIFSGHPAVVSQAYVAQLHTLCTLLNKAFQAIVANFITDVRIRNIYQLDQRLEQILNDVAHLPYQVGFYRPDLLFDASGQARICEIGARYPLNGWMLSCYADQVYQQSPAYKNSNLQSVSGKEKLMEDLYHMFNSQSSVTLIHDDEKGTEIFYLKEEFLARGLQFFSAKPQDLKLKNGQIFLNEHPVSQFILEMDREELKKFDPEVLKTLAEQGTYFNDIRTLLLIHDKRVLVVLADETIMSNYLSAEEYRQLRPFLIPSYAIQHPEQAPRFISAESNLILKLNSGGRGVGAYVKDVCAPKVWQQVLTEKWQHYMIQEYVQQQQYEDAATGKPMHLVGMMLCCNNTCYGPGIFRGSDEFIINVHQGRGLVFPVMTPINS